MSGGAALHPVVQAAAEGRLPEWTRATPERIRHMGRVAAVLERWAGEAGLPARDRDRWAAAGLLHDALKEAETDTLRALVPEALQDLPEDVLHGPAVAARLRAEGVDDPELLAAVSWHTVGHPDLGRLGRAVYAADFLEPGRRPGDAWRDALRERMTRDPDAVLLAVAAARIRRLLDDRQPLRQETVAFWNRIAEGGKWAPASEG